MNVAYRRGLHELGDGLYAYLQPTGTWGWSNAGLITGEGESLLVDTLFDLALTRAMLQEMGPATESHPIIATAAAIEDMQAAPPALMHALTSAPGLPPELEAFTQRAFGPFDFSDIEPRLPTESFQGHRELPVADRRVELIEVGPAHTPGDAIVHVPDAGVVFTGDVLFIEVTPIVWAGPISNWLAACQRIRDLDARILVPGHGPVTDDSGVRDVERYLRYVQDEARARFEAGLDAEAAADDIDISAFRDWGDPERIAVNVASVYRELDPSAPAASPPELFVRMARWSARHGG